MSTPWAEIRRGLRYQFGSFEVRDFSGGLNLRDAPSELAPNESPYASNVTLDERGGVVKRLGLTAKSTLTNAASRMFWSQAFNRGYVQDGTSIKSTTDFVTYVTHTPTLTSSQRVGFADFGGKVVIVSPTDGLFTHPGDTTVAMTSVAAGPKGFSCVPWQNKLWVIGDPANPTRVNFSASSDPTGWTVGTNGAGWVEIRDASDAPLTAIGNGNGLDFVAKPTLLVFKARSTHRINDSTSGSYQTIDANAGAFGPMATTGLFGNTFTVNDRGIWRCDGTHAPTLISQKLQPLFSSDQLAYSQMPGALATTFGQRVLFSLPFGSGVTANTLTLEHNPLVGWFTSHNFGLSAAYPFLNNTSKLYGCGNTTKKIYDVFSGWTDDGATITSNFQSKWFNPAGDNACRVQRLRLFGRGSFSLYFKQDYGQGDGLLSNVAITSGGFTWNSLNWNDASAIWGPTSYEGYQDFWRLGVGKAVSFLFRDTSTTSATGPNVLSTGAGPQVGSSAVYGFQLDFTPLGLS